MEMAPQRTNTGDRCEDKGGVQRKEEDCKTWKRGRSWMNGFGFEDGVDGQNVDRRR